MGWFRIDAYMNIRKQRFMAAVRIIAQNDAFIVRLAERVIEKELPEYPGSIALLFVTAFANLRSAEKKIAPAETPDRQNAAFHSTRRARYSAPKSIPVGWRAQG